MKRKRCKKSAECIERNGWQEALTWQSKSSYTEHRRLCTHEETEKPEKGETTGKIVFIWKYTIVVQKMQLIQVSILFSLIYGIFMHAINCSDITYIKLIMKCNNLKLYVPSTTEFLLHYAN